MPTNESSSPRKRGKKPASRRPLHPRFVAVIRANAPIGPLASVANFPHAEQLYFSLSHPIPVHALNTERLSRLAAHLKYAGPLFAPEADRG